MLGWSRHTRSLWNKSYSVGTKAWRSITTETRSIGNLLQKPAGWNTDDGVITVSGFVRSVRKQKRVAFAALGDGTSLEPLQVVMKPEQAEQLSTGIAVTISGSWKACPPGKKQTHELHADQVRIRGGNDAAQYPIQKKYHTPEFLRTVPHLRSRTPQAALLLRLRSQIIADTTTFFAENGFVQTHTPIITSSDCEGAGEVFTVASSAQEARKSQIVATSTHSTQPFFRTTKYLTVSSQLHLEALAQAVGKVWTLSPTFRAEKSDTARHLSEFYMLEAEMTFVEEADQVMDLVEGLVRSLAQRLDSSTIGRELLARTSMFEEEEGHNESDITASALQKRWHSLIAGPWPRITYFDAVKALQRATSEGRVVSQTPPDAEDGFSVEHERMLADIVGNGGPVFVTDYPAIQKPFYMAPSSKDRTNERNEPTVACFDLLLPDVCEVVGGSMREHRLEQLQGVMKAKGLLPDPPTIASVPNENGPATPLDTQRSNMEWYLDLRRYGSVPHGGFGLGFDRLLCFLSGTANIRDTVTFPRWYERCEC